MIVLCVVPPDGRRAHAIEVTVEPATIGRGLANTVILRDDPRVSLRHATLVPTAEGYLLRDEGSTNGTWVNGRRIATQLVRAGDEIRCGDTRLTVGVGPELR